MKDLKDRIFRNTIPLHGTEIPGVAAPEQASAQAEESEPLKPMRLTTKSAAEPEPFQLVSTPKPPRTRKRRKRASLRTPVDLDLEVQGSKGWLRAQAVDVSRSGILFRLIDQSLVGMNGKRVGAAALERRARQLFGDGLWASFFRQDLELRAEMIRIADSLLFEPGVLVGCRFRRDLSLEECQKLGIAFAPDQWEGPAEIADPFDEEEPE